MTDYKIKLWILTLIGVIFLFPIKGRTFEIVVSNSPLKKIVKELVPEIKVLQILPSEEDFHTYKPKLSQWRSIEEADLVIIVGTEPWAQRVWNLRKNKPTFSLLKKGEVVKDPHLWFDLYRIRILIKKLKNFIIKRFPKKSICISKRTKRFLKKIENLEKELKNFSSCKFKKFYLLGHPVFEYLLKGSGIKEITLVKGYQEQQQPGLKSFVKMLMSIEKLGEKVVFITDPQFYSYKNFFESQGIKVITLWSGGGFSMRGSYIKLLEYNLRQIKKALKCNP